MRSLTVAWRTAGSGVAITDTVLFRYDSLARRDSVHYSNGLTVGYAYDKDGAQRLLCTTRRVTSPSTNDISQFRVVQDWINLDGMTRQTNVISQAVPTGCVSTNKLSSLDPVYTYDNRHQVTTHVEAAKSLSYTYDGSGNLTQTIDGSFTSTDVVAASHNRLVRRAYGPSDYDLYSYDLDGARYDENPCATTTCATPAVGYRRYLYDGLGRTAGFNKYGCVTGGGGTTCGIQPNTSCYYDAAGRMMAPCENGGVSLGYDGENVVRTGNDNAAGYDWTFVHGPGTDDILLGHYPGTANVFAFFVTAARAGSTR
ncbi:MAG: hypothetical protein H0T54_09360 [Geodermatophilaceae bacterium]|nr:hypothetical protein [Geodermatophilaceae bacterium]